jgi:hypothetical protein
MEFNQSPVFCTKSYIQCTKLYGLKGFTGRSMHCNSSPALLLFSPCKATTFSLIEEAIDVLTIDVLTDVHPSKDPLILGQ